VHFLCAFALHALEIPAKHMHAHKRARPFAAINRHGFQKIPTPPALAALQQPQCLLNPDSSSSVPTMMTDSAAEMNASLMCRLRFSARRAAWQAELLACLQWVYKCQLTCETQQKEPWELPCVNTPMLLRRSRRSDAVLLV